MYPIISTPLTLKLSVDLDGISILIICSQNFYSYGEKCPIFRLTNGYAM